ncbi:MAG: hypothetical protein WC700_10245 [Gemmatimonadaceae bacterium]|jgi:uncharacterized protein YbjT (DUF2867 family)
MPRTDRTVQELRRELAVARRVVDVQGRQLDQLRAERLRWARALLAALGGADAVHTLSALMRLADAGGQ